MEVALHHARQAATARITHTNIKRKTKMIEWPTIPTTTKRRPCGAKVAMVCYDWATPPTRRDTIEIMVSSGGINDNNDGERTKNGEVPGTMERGSDTPPVQISPMPFSKEDKTSPVGVYAFFEPPQSKFQHAARAEPTSVLVQQWENRNPVVVHRVSMDCRPAAAAAARNQARKTSFRKLKRRPVHHPHHHERQTPPPQHLEAWRKLAMTMERSEASRLQIQRYNQRQGHALFNKTRHKLMSLAQRELENNSREQQQRASFWSIHHATYRKQNMQGQWQH